MSKPAYFIRAGSDGPIKIGQSIDPNERLRDLQVSHHLKLVLLAVVLGVTERELHVRFSRDRILGEWFFPSDDLLAYIANSPGAREPKLLTDDHRLPTERRPYVNALRETITKYGTSFLPQDLVEMINGIPGASRSNGFTNQNLKDVALLFTARSARKIVYEKILAEAEEREKLLRETGP